MRNLLTIIIFLSISIFSFADFVPKKVAEKAALKYIKAYYNHIEKNGNNILINNTIITEYNNSVVYYTVVFSNGNFVHIAAEDASYPILGFSIDGKINKEINADNYNSWMLQYAKAINEIQENKIPTTKEIQEKWNSITSSQKSIFFSSKSTAPLLLSKWNQDSPYNAECPIDANGPGGRVYAGCVAVAMAQVMYYYRYPEYGTASHSYYHNVYGAQSANFAATNYKWNEMQNEMSYGGNFQIAQLLQHLGISVDMGYSASGSGAYSFTAASALVSYFGYQSSTSLESRSDYTQTQWNNMLIAQLNSNKPMYYHGRDSQGNSGHAFNLDGYQGTDHFHFNWGWSGSYDGYYYLSQLNPGGNDFATGQGAIINIYPASNYPQYCTSTLTTLTKRKGTLTDGSGPLDYLPNSSCEWLIKPSDNIKNLKITFDRFDLSNNDTLFIYDGDSISAPILAKLSGSTLPNYITSTQSSVLLKLITNSTNQDNGFSLSYKSYDNIYCNGLKTLTDTVGSISDGSGTNPYNNNSSCKWSIKPSNGLPIRLTFDSFDTENGVDIVKVYDPKPTPSVLLGMFSGNNIPSSVFSPSGEMLIFFISDPQNTFQGWSASYITGESVGINQTIDEKPYKIHPNPGKDYIHILNKKELSIEEINIYSINGKIAKSINNNDTNRYDIKIDIRELSQGIYFIHIKNKKTTSIQKLIIL